MNFQGPTGTKGSPVFRGPQQKAKDQVLQEGGFVIEEE